MMYDKAYNYISNSIPGSMSQKMAIFGKNHEITEFTPVLMTLHFTFDMMYDKAYNHISK